MLKFNYIYSLLCALAMSTFAFAQQPPNNNCANAIDLSSSLGQGADNVINAGTYDNTNATSGNDDPTTGFECFSEPDGDGGSPSLDNTLWFKITGDGNDYYIEASSIDCSVNMGIDGNDTQMAIYTGTCGALTPMACNEDAEGAGQGNYPAGLQLSTVVGETYYILVDGFSLNGVVFDGEFCMFITQFEVIACNAPNVSGGTASSPTMAVCEGQSTNITVDGALAPNEGALTGYAWVISTMDLEANPDFVVNQNYLAGLNVRDEPTSPLTLTLSDIGTFNPGTTYFFTLVAFGNAIWADPSQQVFIYQADLDVACTTLSNSVQIDYYETADCPETAILNIDESVLGMTIFPNPAQDFVRLNIHAGAYSKATIMVSNIGGQMVQQHSVNLTSGANLFDMDVSRMPMGIYLIDVTTDSHQSVSRFLKQ